MSDPLEQRPPPAGPAVAAPPRPATLRRARYVLPLLLALLLVPAVANSYVQFVVNTVLVYCLVALGFNVVLGYLGELAFANAAFFGLGAYTTGLTMAHFALPFPIALALCGVVSALYGALVSLPALRLRGYYLAIVTLAFGELMRWVYIHGDPFTFGPSGFNVPSASLFGVPLVSERAKYYLFLRVVVLGPVATARRLRSRVGRAFVAVRNNELAAASLGISIAGTKVVAFAWSGLIVGLAGGLYAVLNGRITPDSFGAGQTLLHFAIVMIGGLGSVTGSILGAILLTAAPELLRNFPGVQEIVFSLLLVVVLFFMPRGIGGLLAAKLPALRERLHVE